MTPAWIAAGLRISRSTLYALFKPEDGIESFVFARRLDRAFETIVNDSGRAAEIGTIAFANGFKSAAHFSRAFLIKFGLNPSEVRRLAMARAAETGAQATKRRLRIRWPTGYAELGSGNPAP